MTGPTILVVLLAVAGLGLFVFNIIQAVIGFREMRSFHRRARASQEHLNQQSKQTDQLISLKEQFDRQVEAAGFV